MALLSLRDIQLAFGAAPVLDGVQLHLERGERVCLIGRNGEGKSSLLRVIAGQQQADSGDINCQTGLVMSMLAQDVPQQMGQVFDVVALGAGEAAPLLARYRQAQLQCEQGDMAACEQLATLQGQMDSHDGWHWLQRMDELMSRMGLDADTELSSLSGGRKRRVLLAQALLTQPAILLLDEPTNHLDVESIEWLENTLLSWPGLTLLFISHDRRFVDAIATRIIELDRGVLRSYTGNYSRYQELKAQQLEAEAQQSANFDKKLAQEEVWIRQGIKARRTRNEGRVRALKTLREEARARRSQQGQVNLTTQDVQRSGKLVFEVSDLSIRLGDRQLVEHFSATVMRGDRIGLIGDNGVGKTTLIRALLDELQPEAITSGTIRRGTQLQWAYFDQLREQLNLEQSVLDNVAQGSDFVEINGQRKHVLSYLQDFLFSPQRARTPVKALSGGERNRLLLARLLLKPSNLLILDEPTNDLDMDTLDLLEEAISEYSGTLLLISHDRAFLDAVVTSTWVFDGKGAVNEYVGGYADYLLQRPDPALSAQAAGSGRTSVPAGKAAAASVEITAAAAPAVATTAIPKRAKLSYKEQRELDALPQQIATLEQQQTDITRQLADGQLYVTQPDLAGQLSQQLEALELELMGKLERWTALEG